jgi:NTE family protein
MINPLKKRSAKAAAVKAEGAAVPILQPEPVYVSRTGGPSVALALGGGGARGIAHVHALEALDELGVVPVVIAGTSIGALVGAGYASGMRGWDMAAHFRKSLGDRAEVMARLWRLRPKGIGGIRGGLRPGRVDLEGVLEAFLPEHIPQTFEELDIPLMAVATDYYAQRSMVFRSGPLRPAIAASAAIPALFHPVMINDRALIDGGITNPVPFDLITGLADITVAIDVVGGPSGPADKAPSTIDALFGSSQLLMQAITTEKLKSGMPDVFLRPEVDAWRVMDFLKVREILEQTQPFRDIVKRAVERAIERKVKA